MNSTAALRCRQPGCSAIREEQGGPEAGLCALHRQQARVARGACLNCGAALVVTTEMNNLTGKPLLRDGELVHNYECAVGCGYTRRQRPRRK